MGRVRRDAILSLGPMRQDVGFQDTENWAVAHYSLERPGSSCLNRRRPSLLGHPRHLLWTPKDLCSELAREEGQKWKAALGETSPSFG